LGKLTEDNKKIKIVLSNQQSNLSGSYQSNFSLCHFFGTSEDKQYINLALCPHAAKYILHKMGLAICWLSIYAGDERQMDVYIHTRSKKKQ